jgi:hypothetical protein
MIDDFIDPVGQEGWAIRFYTPVAPNNFKDFETAESVGTILGDDRDLRIQVVSPIPPDKYSTLGAFGDGILEFSSSPTSRVIAILNYSGGDGPGQGLVADLTQGGNSAFQITFGLINAAVGRSTLDVAISVDGPGGPATYAGGASESAGTSIFVVPFSAFSSQTPFTAATGLTFTFNSSATPEQAVVFSINRIEAVPEPTSMMLAAFGVVGVVATTWRMRRRG